MHRCYVDSQLLFLQLLTMFKSLAALSPCILVFAFLLCSRHAEFAVIK